MRVGIILIIIIFLSGCNTIPSDRYLKEKYINHRGEFARIVEMAHADSNVERISSTFVRYYPDVAGMSKNQEISAERLNKYRSLFAKIGVENGIGLQGNKVYFYIYDGGFAGSGVSKGIAWMKNDPAPIFNSLDKYSNESEFSGWSRIERQWYIELNTP